MWTHGTAAWYKLNRDEEDGHSSMVQAGCHRVVCHAVGWPRRGATSWPQLPCEVVSTGPIVLGP